MKFHFNNLENRLFTLAKELRRQDMMECSVIKDRWLNFEERGCVPATADLVVIRCKPSGVSLIKTEYMLWIHTKLDIGTPIFVLA